MARPKRENIPPKTHSFVVRLDDVQYGVIEHADPCNMKLSTWLDIWLKEYTGNLKSSTRSIYDSHVRTHLKPNLGQIQLSKLAPHMVQHLYNELLNEQGLSPKTVKNVHGALHRAMEQARRLGYIRTNPLDAVIVPRVEKTKIETLADQEMLRFLNVIKGQPDELIYYVTVFTGLRQGEVLGLTWDCVDFETNTLLINKQHTQQRQTKEYVFASLKNDKIRTLTVADEVMDALRRQQERQKAWAKAAGSAWSNPDQLVFTNRRIIAIDVQGITGKRKSFSSMPYSKVQFFSIQTPGFAEIIPDAELHLMFSNGFTAKFEFKGNVDIGQIGRMISEYVLE